ncbi:hypothetical protein [Piscirickettsia salmonis]|uniref:hypothetical protein n=1 Tax=Piscirickettsia salmonis TaxID=1238 RepID=UPI00064C856E|nr:hypothetical protein [Piscirickettsia salmonis]KLV34559.1 hypothetical protein AB894_13310 [Piscirickettsia salmonis]
MKKTIHGTGGGGGKGGGSVHTPTEAPNTLSTNAVVTLVDLLGEGEIEGLVNGAQSVYFDDTPLQNADGSYNFEGVTLKSNRCKIAEQNATTINPRLSASHSVACLESAHSTTVLSHDSTVRIDF